MRVLLTLDEHNYEQGMPVYEKYSTRAVIIRDGRIAVQRGAQGESKLLGGGVEPGEELAEAMIREVREESGLVVIPESVRPVGEVVERRRDIFEPDKIYSCHSVVFLCDVGETMVEPSMTESELAKGYHLAWQTPEEFIAGNEAFCGNMPWIYRDTELIRSMNQWME